MNTLRNPPSRQWHEILQRPTYDISAVESIVAEVYSEVKLKGDTALLKYTQLFDGVTIKDIKLSEKALINSDKGVSSELKEAILMARDNITRFHEAQRTSIVSLETMPGVHCWQQKYPIEKVGLYIPGGTAPLFSSLLMLAIPAKLAGCKEIVLCTPPNKEGEVHPAILYTAKLCGINSVMKLGGIQAIAAMALGTQSVPGVYKIFGPGNQYVTAAKQHATRLGIAIDLPAGPSELMVYADDSAVPDFVAADLLSQAEHGSDSQVILISDSIKFIDKVKNVLQRMLHALPRKTIAEKALQHSFFIVMEDKTEAINMINTYAPEHLIIISAQEKYFLENLSHAGSVFLGNYTPESAGDYASGTNHTLPTNGYARSYSGVNLDSFLRAVTFQKISPEGIRRIGGAVITMAEAEGLQAHAHAVRVRLENLKMK